MIKWIAKIKWFKVVLVGLFYTVLSALARSAELLWSIKTKLMVAPVSTSEFVITSTIIVFAIGLSLALIYYYIKDFLPKNYMKRSLLFADLLVATSFIFFGLPMYLLGISWGLLGYWFVSNFIILTLTSLLIVKITK